MSTGQNSEGFEYPDAAGYPVVTAGGRELASLRFDEADGRVVILTHRNRS